MKKLVALLSVVIIFSMLVGPAQATGPAQEKPFEGVIVNLITFTGPQIAEPLQRRGPDFQELTGANATAPIGAGRAIVEAGKKGEVLLVGQDDLPEMVNFVKDETALAMSLQHVPEIGFWSIIYMVALTHGHTVPVVHDTGSFVVDKSTVDTYKQQ